MPRWGRLHLKRQNYIPSSVFWSPGCRCRRWPRPRACVCHRRRRRSRHLAAASPKGPHWLRSWSEQNTETNNKYRHHHRSTDCWQMARKICEYLEFIIVSFHHLFFVLEEGCAEVLPTCHWYQGVLDLVTVEQGLEVECAQQILLGIPDFKINSFLNTHWPIEHAS